MIMAREFVNAWPIVVVAGEHVGTVDSIDIYERIAKKTILL